MSASAARKIFRNNRTECMSTQHDLVTSRPGRKPGRFRLLFVCTANACRSPMAEGFARHYGMGRLDAFSAGIIQAPLDPRAVRVMAELNIDIAHHTHTKIETVSIHDMDLVVTLSEYAQSFSLQGFSTQHRLHWDIPDPMQLWGPDWFVLGTYRHVRDDLGGRIRTLLATILR